MTLKKLPYDTERDFTPITTVAASPLALIGSVKAGMDSMAKFMAAARAEPGKMQFGSSENTTRLGGELCAYLSRQARLGMCRGCSRR